MVALVQLAFIRPQCGRCWHASLICCIDRVSWCYLSILLVCRYKLSVFFVDKLLFYVWETICVQFFLEHSTECRNCLDVPLCPSVDLQMKLVDAISIWQFNVDEYESFISLGHIDTIERQAFHLFLKFSVVVYCISFHALFSPILWLIVRFWFSVFSALLSRPLFWFCSVWQTYWSPVVWFTFWSECWTSFTVKSMAFTTFETLSWPSRTC